MANTSWTTTSGSISLSGSNLIATGSGTGSALAGAYIRSGKFYAEATFNVKANTNTSVGIAPDGTTYAAVYGTGGSLGHTSMLVNGSGNLRVGGETTNIIALSVLTLLCIAVDMDNRLLWVRSGGAGNWNASATADPATGRGGVSIPYEYITLYCQTGANLEKITLNSGDSAFTGTVPSGFTSGWTTATDPQDSLISGTITEGWTTSSTDYSPAAVSGALVESWIGAPSIETSGVVSGDLVEAWISSEARPTEAIVTGDLVEVWGRQAFNQAYALTSNVIVEVWFAVGSGRPVIPPDEIYCATVAQDAEGDPGSPGTGMTDQVGGTFTPDNAPVDAAGDVVTDPAPITFLFDSETLSCTTSALNSDSHDAGSTGTGITSILGDTITQDVQPTNATGDVVTTNTGVSDQFDGAISCITAPANASGDSGSSGAGVTDQLDAALTCNQTPQDADGGSGVPPATYSKQIP